MNIRKSFTSEPRLKESGQAQETHWLFQCSPPSPLRERYKSLVSQRPVLQIIVELARELATYRTNCQVCHVLAPVIPHSTYWLSKVVSLNDLTSPQTNHSFCSFQFKIYVPIVTLAVLFTILHLSVLYLAVRLRESIFSQLRLWTSKYRTKMIQHWCIQKQQNISVTHCERICLRDGTYRKKWRR